MALFSKTITLNAGVQNLESGVSTITPAQQGASLPMRLIKLQAGGANGNAIFVGHDNTVSSTLYGERIPAASGGVPAVPTEYSASSEVSIKLADFWVIGTNAEILHIIAIPF